MGRLREKWGKREKRGGERCRRKWGAGVDIEVTGVEEIRGEREVRGDERSR